MLHFVDRQPGLTIAELLDILRITKQSLNRVLKELIEKGFIESRTGTPTAASACSSRHAEGPRSGPEARQAADAPHHAGALRMEPEAKDAVSRYLLSLIDPRRPRPCGAPRIRRPAKPDKQCPTPKPEPWSRIDIPDHAPHVLVVDDDRRLRDLLARFLSENGYRVTTAASAAEARAKAESFVFDALVLDVMMPGETGFDYARSLRQTSQVPILMLTARADAADRVTGLEIGADDYLPKPFEPRELLLRLGNILKRAMPAPAPADAEPLEVDPFRALLVPLRPRRVAARTTRSCASPSVSARS